MAKRRAKSRIVLGLNSGTSCDGVDAVACEISGRGAGMKVRVLGHVELAYPDEARERLLRVMAPAATTTEEICRLHTLVGRVFAAAAVKAVVKLGLRRVDLVGSHGQTICHLPPRNAETSKRRNAEIGNVKKSKRQNAKTGEGAEGLRGRGDEGGKFAGRESHSAFTLLESSGTRGETGTLQIGDAAIVSAAVGAPVVSDFRHADMAVGGQGAPLVPWTDYVLFRDVEKSRVIQNIGGIANLTWLPAGCDEGDVIAFDCGPGNMVIDALVRHFSGGREAYDRNGRMAARGRVLPKVLAAMMSHPYLEKAWPKSCGREEFGAGYVESLLKRFGGEAGAENWIATATRFTAECIARAYANVVVGGMGNRGVGVGGEKSLLQRVAQRAKGRLSAARAGGSLGARAWRGLVSRLNTNMRSARASKRPLAHATHANTGGIDEVIVCGGGARNTTLLKEIGDAAGRLGVAGELCITDMKEHGIHSQAKEGVSFAMLAATCVDGVAGNLPGVTGARKRVVLGLRVEV